MVPGDIELSSRYGMRTEEFSALMKHRVLEVLLVASQYDAFTLEEDGQLTELLFEEYRNLDLNLRYAPRFARAETAAQSLELLGQRPFDLLVTTPRVPDIDIHSFVQKVRQMSPGLPICLLAAHAWDLPRLEELRRSGEVDWIFLWQGSVSALLALIKQVEDRRNADSDILEGGVQAVILVEDEVRDYSAILPHLYREVTMQTGHLMAEGLNLSHRLLRIRARPKILLAQSFEEAMALYQSYAGNLLGIVTDGGFPRSGVIEDRAGIALAQAVREREPDLPIVVQSRDRSLESAAREIGCTFLSKGTSTSLDDLARAIRQHFGFGPFLFRHPDGRPIAQAADIREMVRLLADIPAESLMFHASRNHFSAWLKARTEFELATALRPRKASEFSSGEELRSYLISTLNAYLRKLQSHIITDFDSDRFDRFVAFAKIGSGSIGGKGRGLAFMHKLIAQEEFELPGVSVTIPQTLVLATDVFENFVETNDLRSLIHVLDGLDDDRILDRFRRSRFDHGVRSSLGAFLEAIDGPLAVRSSSLLEDSLYQPFAGVYATVMLPNSHPSLDVRLAQLLEAIKVVYASTYSRAARDYLDSTPHRIEEERMAVLVQRLVGSRRGELFYPTVSGVAASYNFYPFRDLKPEEGVAQIALGLGKSVVEGFEALRFCPAHPEVLPQFSAVKDILRNAQRRFYALDMSRADAIPSAETDANLVHVDVLRAIEDGAARPVASTFDRANHTITSGLTDGGAPLITFAPLLKSRTLPLPEVLSRLLVACQAGLGAPVELEFALDLGSLLSTPHTLHVLQVRPMVVEDVRADVSLADTELAAALVQSEVALGHGRRETLADLVVVDPERLERAATARVAIVVDELNTQLRTEGRQFVLIGPGRWGSRDPWLGIPVTWPQISAARAIVETDFPDLLVEPSFGSHFFHNLTCFGVAFFAVHEIDGTGRINWEWLRACPAASTHLDGAVRHLRLDRPVQVVVDGSVGHGVILESNSY